MKTKDIEKHIELFLEGNFGIEKESLRVTGEGYIAHTPHPYDAIDMHKIDRDFCENQIEIITGVHNNLSGAYEELKDLHKLALSVLRDRYEKDGIEEYIWPFSNPAYVKGEEDIPVAKFVGHLKGKEVYRQYLASKYGKRKMLYSGIHFNFSFSDKLEEEGIINSLEEKNDLYLNLAKQYTKYAWLLVYLMAASPVFDESFIEGKLGKTHKGHYASPRCGKQGYWNDFIPILDYENIGKYVDSINKYVEDGQLKTAAELYYPIRLKPNGEYTMDNLLNMGIGHLEIRVIDLNPLSTCCFEYKDAVFIHGLTVYLLAQGDIEFDSMWQAMSITNCKKAALLNDNEISVETGWNEEKNIRIAAFEILDKIRAYYTNLKTKDISEKADKDINEILDSIDYQLEKIEIDNNRYADRILAKFSDDYVKKGIELAKKNMKDNLG